MITEFEYSNFKENAQTASIMAVTIINSFGLPLGVRLALGFKRSSEMYITLCMCLSNLGYGLKP